MKIYISYITIKSFFFRLLKLQELVDAGTLKWAKLTPVQEKYKEEREIRAQLLKRTR